MAHETDDLEPQQYARHYIEDDVPLKDVRKSTLRRSVYIGLGLFALIVLAGATIKFPDEVSLPFVLKSDAPEDVYRFPYPVFLAEHYIRSGSKVAAGAPLVKITSPEIVAMINTFREAEEAVANYRKHNPRYLGNQQAILHVRMEQNTRRTAEADRQLALLGSAWKSNEARLRFELEDAEKKLEQNRKLHEGKYISSQELKEYETRKIKAQDAFLSGTQAYERERAAILASTSQSSLENVSLGREGEQASISAATDSATLAARLKLAGEKLHNTFGEFEISGGSLILKATGEGTVSFLFDGDKELPASAILLRLLHRQGALYALVVSPPTMIGKLAQQQDAYLKVATFPAYEWGAAKGHVDALSLTPDEAGAFNLRVALDEQRNLAGHLQPGMTGLVAIQLGERTFFQYFFRKLRKTAAIVTGNQP